MEPNQNKKVDASNDTEDNVPQNYDVSTDTEGLEVENTKLKMADSGTNTDNDQNLINVKVTKINVDSGVNTEHDSGFINRNREVRNEVKSEYEKVSVNETIINYDPEGGMNLESWMEYFNQRCAELNKTENWKIKNIHKYLKGSALTLYINSCIHLNTWDELCSILKEEYITISSVSFSEFTSLHLTNNDNLTQYFHTKLGMGRKLGLSKQMLLEGLTDGLPVNLKQLLTLQAPGSPTDWLTLANKLIKLQKPEIAPPKTVASAPSQPKPKYVPPPQEYYRAPLEQRQWRPRAPYQQQGPGFRYSQPYQPKFQSRNERPRGPPQNVHYQDRYPPSPCRHCERRGILRAYHWGDTCIFKDQGHYQNDNVVSWAPTNNEGPYQQQQQPEQNLGTNERPAAI